jgi:hypothetical protein
VVSVAEGVVQVPPDSTGARIRTRSRTISAATVHEQYVIPTSERVRSGVYLGATGIHTVQATADTAPAGRWYLHNPTGSTVLVALRRIEFSSQLGSALAAPTSPRLILSRFSATGTGTATITAASTDPTTMPASTGRLLSATTGLSLVVSGIDVFSFLPTASATAVGYAPPGAIDWNPEEEGMPVIQAGQGLYLRQADAGTASDTRRFVTSIAWEEYTIP